MITKAYQLVRNVILSVDMITMMLIQIQHKILRSLLASAYQDTGGAHKSHRGWEFQAPHVLSLELSRSSSDSIISERSARTLTLLKAHPLCLAGVVVLNAQNSGVVQEVRERMRG